MRFTFLCLIIGILSTNVFESKAQSGDLLFHQDSLKKVGEGFSFTEGCSTDKAGNVFFTDQPNDKVWKYSLDGKISVFLEKTGRANGTYFDKKGNLILCADENGEIWSVSKSTKVKVLLKKLDGKQFNGPNDLWIDAKGGIYFTDPYYQRPYWTRTTSDLSGQDTYYLPKGADQPILVADGLRQPNGIVGSPDGKHLFISDIASGKTYKYDIAKDGSLSGRELLVEKGSDGMTLDLLGNTYLTGNDGVHIYSSKGKFIGLIKVPKGASNVCFWGKDKSQLFITAKDAIYTIKTNTRGVE